MASILANMPLEVGGLILTMADDIATVLSFALVSPTFNQCADPVLYRRIHIDVQNAAAFLASIKYRQPRDATFFARTVKALYIDTTCSVDEHAEMEIAIQSILTTCTGLTALGFDYDHDTPMQNHADIVHRIGQDHPLYPTLLNLGHVLDARRISIDAGALPTSLTRLHCNVTQMIRWRTSGDFFALLPQLTHIHMNCQLNGDSRIFSLMKDALPATVKLCSYEIHLVSGPIGESKAELKQVLREIKDPRVIVLAHPTFEFPSLPNLVRFERDERHYDNRTQLDYWAEAEEFARGRVLRLEAAVEEYGRA